MQCSAKLSRQFGSRRHGGHGYGYRVFVGLSLSNHHKLHRNKELSGILHDMLCCTRQSVACKLANLEQRDTVLNEFSK